MAGCKKNSKTFLLLTTFLIIHSPDFDGGQFAPLVRPEAVTK